jgi:hypothetical protein
MEYLNLPVELESILYCTGCDLVQLEPGEFGEANIYSCCRTKTTLIQDETKSLIRPDDCPLQIPSLYYL